MRELSLFSGAGGGLLGTHLLGWRPIGYVEWNDYCQRIIAARIKDGILPDAPIFGDIHAFNRDGYASAYTGMVDVVTGGFPCQPFSLAGKRQGAADERNGWPATIECLRIIRPEWALLENVPGLIVSGYFDTILGDLAESGFDVRWRVLSAAEVGAPHRRDRLWIMGHAQRGGFSRLNGRGTRAKPANRREDVADAESLQLERKPSAGDNGTGHQSAGNVPGQPAVLADAKSSSQAEQSRVTDSEAMERASTGTSGGTEHGDSTARIPVDRRVTASSKSVPTNTSGTRLAQRHERKTERGTRTAIDGCDWWAVEPDVGRVANGVAARVDRLKALGNGQVPAVVRAAWLLMYAE